MSLTNTKQLETNRYELTITVDAATFEAGLSQAFRKNVKSISVPGFRKGKAPRKMVEKMYGEGVFFEDAVNIIFPEALEAAIKEANLELVARPEVDIKEINREEGFSFTAICVTKPEVEVRGYKGIVATKAVKTVTDADIENRLEAVQKRNARVIEVTDRAAIMGDTVVFDFDGSIDGVHFDGGKAEAFSLELGSGQFIPGFEEQIVGRSIGEEFDVPVAFPENYHSEELKGKAAVFACKLHEIKGKEMPALDDEFAKDVSEFDTLEEYKSDIRTKLQEAAAKEADNKLESDLVDGIIENMSGEIPNEMFEARIDDMVRDFEHRLQSQGMNLEIYLQYTGMELDSFRLTFEEQAHKQVKVRLALEKIAELEKFEVTEEELEAEYARIAEAYHMDLDKVKASVVADELKKDVMTNRAIDLIKTSAVVTEETASPEQIQTQEKESEEDKPKKAVRKPRAKKATEDESEGTAQTEE